MRASVATPDHDTRGTGPRWLNPVILAVFVVAAGIMLARHAMWRDEMQAWLIARDAAGMSGLLQNLRYDGHPALWLLMLWPLTRISSDPVLMQALHLVIASASVALVLWRAPLWWWERVLFPSGYFFVYEYAVKSRGYALGGLLLFLLCAVWRQRRERPLTVALLLALMANVKFLFLIVAMAMLVTIAVDRVLSGRTGPVLGPRDVPALVVVAAGWAVAIATVVPPADSGYAVGWFTAWDRARLVEVIGMLGVIVSPPAARWSTIAAIAVLAVIAIRWKDNPPVAVFALASVGGLLAFFYVKYPGNIWHYGLIFLVLFAAVWIDRERASQAEGRRTRPLLPGAAFAAILILQTYAGVRILSTEWRQPLSNGRNVAAFIADKGWAGDPLVAIPDFFAAPVIGYLGIRRAYYLNGGRWGSFTVWDQARLERIDVDQAIAVAAPAGEAMTWVVDLGAAAEQMGPVLVARGFTEAARFTGAREENYVLYRRPSHSGMSSGRKPSP